MREKLEKLEITCSAERDLLQRELEHRYNSGE